MLAKWLMRKRQESNLPGVRAHLSPDLKSVSAKEFKHLSRKIVAFKACLDRKKPQFKPQLCALVVLALAGNAHASNFSECRMAGVSDSATENEAVIASYFNGKVLPEIPMDGTWTTIDVSHLVPPETRCVRLIGLLMITQGNAATSTYACDLHIGFRRYGYESGASRGAQTVAVPGTSQRSTWSRWVPVEYVAGQLLFEVRIEGYNVGGFPGYRLDLTRRYPDSCGMGVAAWIDAYGD